MTETKGHQNWNSEVVCKMFYVSNMTILHCGFCYFVPVEDKGHKWCKKTKLKGIPAPWESGLSWRVWLVGSTCQSDTSEPSLQMAVQEVESLQHCSVCSKSLTAALPTTTDTHSTEHRAATINLAFYTQSTSGSVILKSQEATLPSFNFCGFPSVKQVYEELWGVNNQYS